MFKEIFFSKELKELKECKLRNSELERKLTDSTNELSNRDYLIEAYKIDVNRYKEEVNSLKRRIESYAKTLSDRIKIHPIKNYIKNEPVVEVNPFSHDNVIFNGYEQKFADETYYAYSLAIWQKILERIQPEVKKALNKWRVEISDCDDWALVMNSFVSIAFADAGIKHQGAFMILWSGTHAYNGFVDVSKNVWIYEPQNGKIIGKIENGKAPYDTRLVWFVGDENVE